MRPWLVMRPWLGLRVALLLALFACDEPAPAPDPRQAAIGAVKETLSDGLDEFLRTTEALRDAAPEHPWSDAELATLRARWAEARDAYERIEGAVGTLFPHIDHRVDDRYEGFIERAADADPFDGEGLTGMHAVERVLWAGEHPEDVVAFESRLRHHEPARRPATDAESRSFRDALLGRLVTDVRRMRDDFRPLALDPAAAYRGVLGSVEEQLEKVDQARSADSESRYARRTLADMRQNLAGGRALVDDLRPWLRAAPGGDAIAAAIDAGLDRLAALYAATPGDALPEPPAEWPRRVEPSAEQLASPYGRLWAGVRREATPDDPTSLLSAMLDGARALEIPVRPRAPIERLPRPN